MAPNHPIVEIIDHIPFRSDEGACRLPDTDAYRVRGFRIGDLDDIRTRLATFPLVQRERDGHRLAPSRSPPVLHTIVLHFFPGRQRHHRQQEGALGIVPTIST